MIYIIIIKNIYNTLNKLKKLIFKILLQNSKKSFSKYFYKTQKSHFQNTFTKLKKVFLDF